MKTPLGDTPEAALALMKGRAVGKSGFSTFAVATPVEVWDGYAELTVEVRPELTQHHGYAHGAIVGMVADNACAWSAASVAGDVLTAGYTIQFLAPAKGTRLRGKGWVVKAGRRQIVARAEVWSEDDIGGEPVLVASAQGTVMAVSR
ncbi:MAG: PaaI family thioesterase [Pseudomonadota bacterium]